MQPPIMFNQSGTCRTCRRYTYQGMAAVDGMVVCASCFRQGRRFECQAQEQRDTGNGLVRIELDPSLLDACTNVPFHSMGGLRITADDGRVFEGPAYQWCLVAWRAQQAGITHGKAQAIPWVNR